MFRTLRKKTFLVSLLLPVYLLLTFSTGKGLVLCLEENGNSRIEATSFRLSPTDISKITNICTQVETCSGSAACGTCLDIPLSLEATTISHATYNSLCINAFYANPLKKYSSVPLESLSSYNQFETNRLFHNSRLTSIRTIVLLI